MASLEAMKLKTERMKKQLKAIQAKNEKLRIETTAKRNEIAELKRSSFKVIN